MHPSLKILIVEDEVLIAEDLKEILLEVGYTEVFKARNYAQAIEAFNTKSIDIVLLDINLNDAKSGIDIGLYIHQNIHLPFIYITSYSDAETIASVKQTKPSAFLLKPYNKAHLLASIEIAFFNYSTNHNAADKQTENKVNDESDFVINKHLLVKDGYRFIKVPLEEILWFESDKNYIDIKTKDRKYTIRSSMKKIMENLPDSFLKCHRQYLINLNHVTGFNSNIISIGDFKIPLSRNEQELVIKRLKM